MSELNDMSCEEFAEVAAQLALGVLTGREHAGALAHLDWCEACREDVRQLTSTGEELVGLLPASEPPSGFETWVLERIGLAAPAPAPAAMGARGRMAWISHLGRKPKKPRIPGKMTRPPPGRVTRPRRLIAAAAVAFAGATAGLGGWGLGVATAPQAWSPLSSAAFVSASHQTAGTIFVYAGSPGWLYMNVDLHWGDGIVVCQVIGTDGHVTTIGSFRLTDGYGAWGSPESAHMGQLAGARLVSLDGTVLAMATLPGH